MGLFMGVSLLSIVEIIHYFTIHLFCRLANRWKSGEESIGIEMEKEFPQRKETKGIENAIEIERF